MFSRVLLISRLYQPGFPYRFHDFAVLHQLQQDRLLEHAGGFRPADRPPKCRVDDLIGYLITPVRGKTVHKQRVEFGMTE